MSIQKPPTMMLEKSPTLGCCDDELVLLAYRRIRPESALSKATLTYEVGQEWAEVFIRSYIGR